MQRSFRLKLIAGCALSIAIALWAVSASKATHANTEEGSTQSSGSASADQSPACGNTRQTLVVLDAEKGIQLMIPQAFLGEPFKTSFRPVLQPVTPQPGIGQIGIGIRKDTFQPFCERPTSANTVLNVRLSAVKTNQFTEALKEARDEASSGTAQSDDPNFEKYITKLEPPRGYTETLIPKGAIGGKAWIKCSYGGTMRGSVDMCFATQKVSENIIAVYAFQLTDLARYKEIFANAERLVGDFITNGKDRKPDELVQNFCSNSEKVTFHYRGANPLHLEIPAAYLFDRYGSNRDRDPARWISIEIKKGSYAPNCDHEMGGYKRLINITIKPSGKTSFEKMRENHARRHVVKVGEEGDFELFRTKKAVNAGELKGTTDLLVPKSLQARDMLFIECVRPGLSHFSGERAGCHVYSRLNDTIHTEYVIDSIDLPEYKTINQKIEALVSGFIVQP